MMSKKKPRPIPKKNNSQQESNEDLKKTRLWRKIFIGLIATIGSVLAILATIATVSGYTLKDFIQKKDPSSTGQPIMQQPLIVRPNLPIQDNVGLDKSKFKATKPGPPRVLLIPSLGQLNLHNLGKSDLYLWGTKLENKTPTIEKEPRVIPPGTFYYFFSDSIRLKDGYKEGLVPFHVYLSDISNRHYIANFDLLIKGDGQKFTIHTQQLGVVEGKW